MKTIAILARKGGTGKTTLTIHLATKTAGRSGRVLIADTDPQASAMVWQQLRQHAVPKVLPFKVRELVQDIGPIENSGADMVFIDTPPHSTEDSLAAVKLADFVLVPTRPALLDLAAIDDTIKIIKDLKKPGAIVLNCCPPPGRYGELSAVKEARQKLIDCGLPVAPTAISQRALFSHALIDGKTATEVDESSKAALEIHQLWNWLTKAINT